MWLLHSSAIPPARYGQGMRHACVHVVEGLDYHVATLLFLWGSW